MRQLTHLESDQIESLLSRAEHLRKRAGAAAGPLDAWVERVVKSDARKLSQADERVQGVVCSVTGSQVVIESAGASLRANPGSQALVVGDEVTVAQLAGGWTVAEVAPRRTFLARPDVSTGKRQMIVANVDVVVVVVSVVSPPLHPRLIDRYLVAIREGGAIPVVFVNKLDLLEDATELEALESYQSAGVSIFKGSTYDRFGLDQLRDFLSEKVVAFVGHSGVGKSSVVNALLPSAELAVGAVSEGYGRGTHTTTTSSRHRLEGGTVLIDTPGIRSFGLSAVALEDLSSYFVEFEGLRCKFRDCRHIHEPGCAVVESVEAGRIDRTRYETYLRMLGEVE